MLLNPPKTLLKRLLWPFWALLYWVHLFVFAFMAFVVNVSAVATSFLPAGNWRYSYYQWMLRSMTRGFLLGIRVLGIMHIRYDGVESIPKDRLSIKPILVANHPNLLDVFLFYKKLPRLTCIYKASLKKTLIQNSMGEQLGFISNENPKQMIRQGAECVRAGEQLVIFPEGTRTDTWPLNELKLGAIGIARRADVALQTVVIHSASNFLAKKQPLWKPPILPIYVRVELGAVFHPSDYPSSRALSRAMADYFKAQLREERTFE
jgi:1-acyl-sn-glycerol-3-phosphate acyltransferase